VDLGFLLGFLAAIALTNLLLFGVARQRPMLTYALALTSAILELTTPLHAAFGWFYLAVSAYFTRTFLELPEYDPKLDRSIFFVVAVSALAFVAALLPASSVWTADAALAFVVLILLLVVISGVRAARRDYRGARFFVVGSAGIFVCETLAVMFPTLPLDLHGIGIAWAGLWFTVALADRMNEVARERENLRVSRAELEVLAELDPLTGIPNRRSFDDHLQIGWTRAVRAGTSLGIIMIDVDHFKEYNDSEGHIAGDLCLSKIAQACASSMKRNGDFLARYGGEEFGGILVTQTDDDIAVVAERMRTTVAELAIPHPTNPGGIVTISLGVARIRPSARENPLDLVAAADDALYVAKSRGRNQVGTTPLATS